MRNEVLCQIRSERLLCPGDEVICAVSGGADSMAMLWCLYLLREELAIRVRAVHCNHGLRGAESDTDETFVRLFCQQYNIPLETFSLNVRAQCAKTGQSVEDAARTLRYECFAQLAPPRAKVATAHTLDDLLETALIRMVRGTSPRGLGGIPPKRGRIIRPLLSVSRAQVLAFLTEHSIAHREDRTNAEPFCLRNRLRLEVLPRLEAENPQIAAAWYQTAQQLREEDAYLSALAAAAAAQTEVGDGFSIQAVLQLPPVLQRRVLFHHLGRFGVAAPQQSHLALLQRLMYSSRPSAAIDLPGVRLTRQYDLIRPQAESSGGFSPVRLSAGSAVSIAELGVRVRCGEAKNFSEIVNTPTTFTLKCGMIDMNSLVARPRMSGDRIRLPGGSRSLKRLMIDRRIPAAQRDRLIVIADRNGVLAVQSIGADQSRTADGASPCIQIQIESEATHDDAQRLEKNSLNRRTDPDADQRDGRGFGRGIPR